MIHILKKVPLFTKLSEDHLELIVKHSNRRKIAAHTLLFRENDPGSFFLVILKGSIKIYTNNKTTGEEKILSIFKAGDSFGELSLIDGKPRSASAQTLEETILLSIARDDFMRLLKDDFNITQAIMIELSIRLRETNQHVNDLTFLDPRTRIIKNVIQLANRLGSRDHDIIYANMPLNNDELSQMAGVTKKELSEVIRELETSGVLSMEMNSFILNLSKVRQ